MIELYLILTVVNGVPAITSYPTETVACSAADAAVSPSVLIKETIDRHDAATFVVGTCQPTKRFVPKS